MHKLDRSKTEIPKSLDKYKRNYFYIKNYFAKKDLDAFVNKVDIADFRQHLEKMSDEESESESFKRYLESSFKKYNNCTKLKWCNLYKDNAKSWDDFSKKKKSALWTELNKMQGARCAYCESKIRDGFRQIEHFVEKQCDPDKTFDWNNLFGGCVSETCGTHKASWKEQNGGCDALEKAKIIKPDEDDPEKFLIFVGDGTVHPREELKESQPDEYERAKKTIEIFNLNGDQPNGGIVQKRRISISKFCKKPDSIGKFCKKPDDKEYKFSGYTETLEELHEMTEEELEEVREFIEAEVAATAHLPFATAIKHVLTNQSA